MKTINLLLAISLLTTSFSLVAKEDTRDSKYHPLISRYPDFYIKQYAQVEFDEAKLIVAGFNEKTKHAETITIEGRVTNIRYSEKQRHSEVSVLQLYKNYENALKKLGAEFIFACRNESCFKQHRRGVGVYITNWANKQGSIFKGIRSTVQKEFGILTATVSPSANEKTYLMIIVSTDPGSGYGSILMSIIEPESLDIEKVAIGSPDDLHKAIGAQGKVVLEGVYFDHNKANIKPESANTLQIIATYLKASPDSRFYVVGHTDNTGSYDHNLKLSTNRAQAVLESLVRTHDINAGKLKAIGIGPASPAASNADKNGQAINRRVELVLARQF